MKNIKKIWLIVFLSFYLLAGTLLFIPSPAQAGIFDVTEQIDFEPQVGIPNSEFNTAQKIPVGSRGVNEEGQTVVRSDLLARYINAFYQWGLSIVAVIAVVVLMAGGITWLTSAGDSGAITKAKTMIAGSLVGMTLLIGSWLLLNTINPDLTSLPALEMVVINKKVTVCCEENGVAYLKEKAECKGTVFEGSAINYTNSRCEKTGCCFLDSYKNQGQTIKGYCIDTISVKCNANATFKANTNCASLESCKQNEVRQMNCTGVEDGKKCNNAESSQAFCYSNRCYIGLNKLNEPCGNEGGTCSTSCGGKYDERDLVGGSSCDSGLKCCIESGTW